MAARDGASSFATGSWYGGGFGRHAQDWSWVVPHAHWQPLDVCVCVLAASFALAASVPVLEALAFGREG